jgi:hypothetical protein
MKRWSHPDEIAGAMLPVYLSGAIMCVDDDGVPVGDEDVSTNTEE